MRLFRIFPAILSFLLPGLGQLYKKKRVTSLLFFWGFISALTCPCYLFLITWLVIGASLEAYFVSPVMEEAPRNKRRDAIFAVVGLIGLLCWTSFLLGI